MRKMPTKAVNGFSLVEVALALLVASVGLMSVMSLFPVGMDASKKAIDESQCALFAEEIINGFRAQSELAAVKWSDLDTLELERCTKHIWEEPDKKFQVGGSPGYIEYQYSGSDIVEYAIKYQISVGKGPKDGTKYIRLRLWNGKYTDITKVPAMVFYTELYDTGNR